MRVSDDDDNAEAAANMADDCASRAFDIAALKLAHRVDSASRRLQFLAILHSKSAVARRAHKTIQAMETFGSALEAYAPEAEIPWMLCLRWQFLKIRHTCSQRIRHFIAPGSKQFKGSTNF